MCGVRGLTHPHTWVLGRRWDVALAGPLVERDAAGVTILGRVDPAVLPHLDALLLRLDAGRALLDGTGPHLGRDAHCRPASGCGRGPASEPAARTRPGISPCEVVQLFPRPGDTDGRPLGPASMLATPGSDTSRRPEDTTPHGDPS
jgi:hypothetical protein